MNIPECQKHMKKTLKRNKISWWKIRGKSTNWSQILEIYKVKYYNKMKKSQKIPSVLTIWLNYINNKKIILQIN
jgi:hypothetical protein